MKAERTALSLQELCDRTQIADLINHLGQWLDEKRFDDSEWNSFLFLPNLIVETPGGKAEGMPSAVEQAKRQHWHERTQHLHTNLSIRINGDEASAECNLLATFVPKADLPYEFTQAGTRYFFRLVRTAEGWKFAEIRDRLIFRHHSNPA